MIPRLKEKYRTVAAAALREQFAYRNVNQIPRLTKIVVNMGVGDALQDSKRLEGAVADLTAITGQKPVVRRAHKAIANFKLQANAAIGCSVTLRGDRMYEFCDRLFNVALPRVRDFQGVSPKGFDGRGNYTLGIKEQIIFPEIDFDKVDKLRGMNITFVSSAESDDEGRALLQALGMPFAKKK